MGKLKRLGVANDMLAISKAKGLALRRVVPLEDHAEVEGIKHRPDPIAILIGQDQMRVQQLVPIRHGRMRVSPFAFYRGAAAIMASDLSRGVSTNICVQLGGDAHLANFGLFNGADRRLVFDVNDFDETAPGPFEWDLKRLATSVTIAAQGLNLPIKKIGSATRAAVRGYRETMGQAILISPLDLHYFRLEVDSLLNEVGHKEQKQAKKTIAKASRKTSLRALDKLTEVVNGQRRIVADPPVIVRIDDSLESIGRERLEEFFDAYLATLAPHRAAVIRRYRFVDMAHKIVGVGSVGTRCFILLLESDQGEPLFMQFKEATQSVLEPYVGDAGFAQAGERVVRGQRLMQSTGDILLGWSSYKRENGSRADFYIRQLWDGKGSANIDSMTSDELKRYASHCGKALALAHARTGDAAMISGYLGDDETADYVLADFADRYADLNVADHADHERAIDTGRLSAKSDC
ncbi:DUF2252 domain-containing protein [Marinobacter sp. F4206]|uniref:DUF2252 domain-containing protein n=1 Tax=Marinobacter sp. F4206 TaxID=2861777 RepID=UPI001C602C89|nr:DUF2252 domain-containing protein [Marinobacter sp. F4206]MBW4936018.1 DUF2252 domain-containing protein [Marinobacter sp. F4206]